jgi:hypothetical protein
MRKLYSILVLALLFFYGCKKDDAINNTTATTQGIVNLNGKIIAETSFTGDCNLTSFQVNLLAEDKSLLVSRSTFNPSDKLDMGNHPSKTYFLEGIVKFYCSVKRDTNIGGKDTFTYVAVSDTKKILSKAFSPKGNDTLTIPLSY